MTIRKKRSAAEMLTRQLNSTKSKPAESIDDEFALAVARRLEARQIAKVPGVPDDQPEPQWYDISIEMVRRHREFLAEREAKRQAKQQAAQSTPDLIRSTLAGASRQSAPTTMPLNGDRVLRAALAGGAGTINSTRR
ncbi:hypothetical protein [Mycolicibacterium peregrinum]|uniref:Uncharacterized protein n=1 Tax=Mycolicibacterium peregrinum TaxID=43304 RepID=A0A4Z0HSP0_MYCPR|nr:hypothetical protein [Mycolicibacterium peregrinum]TGB41452.1 hypothetical protein EJD98_16165 [Mycolicibacterium peregrinum]TGB41824.1 hypothetical protein EJD94_15665 [Mycolicibacterium peregrinum]